MLDIEDFTDCINLNSEFDEVIDKLTLYEKMESVKTSVQTYGFNTSILDIVGEDMLLMMPSINDDRVTNAELELELFDSCESLKDTIKTMLTTLFTKLRERVFGRFARMKRLDDDVMAAAKGPIGVSTEGYNNPSEFNMTRFSTAMLKGYHRIDYTELMGLLGSMRTVIHSTAESFTNKDYTTGANKLESFSKELSDTRSGPPYTLIMATMNKHKFSPEDVVMHHKMFVNKIYGQVDLIKSEFAKFDKRLLHDAPNVDPKQLKNIKALSSSLSLTFMVWEQTGSRVKRQQIQMWAIYHKSTKK